MSYSENQYLPTKAQMEKQNNLLSVLVRQGMGSTTDWASLTQLAGTGLFGDVYDFGTRFIDTWKDTQTNTSYNFEWELNHIGDVQLADGETLSNRPFLQMHYAHPFGVQFSHQRAFLACPDGLSAGTYYFTFESSWGSNISAGDVVCFTTTVAIPAGGRISGCYGAPDQAKSNWRIYTHSADGKTKLETITPTFTASGTSLGTVKSATRNGNLNSAQEMAYGWNRWSTSALRQYLNSSATKNNWWTAQDAWDIAPDELATKDGFLCGCEDDFLASLKAVKVTTYTNTVQDGGEADITYDKVFIPSLQQMYINPQISGEGEYHERWKRQAGRDSVMQQYQTYPQIITYAVENQTSPQTIRLRSCGRGYACDTWCVSSSGNVGHSGASYSFRFSPLVVL